MTREDALQMVSAASDSFSAAQWCECANVLAEELHETDDALRTAIGGWNDALSRIAEVREAVAR